MAISTQHLFGLNSPTKRTNSEILCVLPVLRRASATIKAGISISDFYRSERLRRTYCGLNSLFHYLLRDYGLLDRIIQRAGPKTEIGEVGCVLLCIGFLPRRNRRQKAMLKPKIGRLWE
jgi:hypothetical protein